MGVLSSSIWVLYKGRIFLVATERKNITGLFCFERAHYEVFNFFCFPWFSFRAYGNLASPARNVCRLNSQISQDSTFVHYPFFVLNITLFTFSYRNFCTLFVSFDILWQLPTTHPRDNTPTGTQIVRAKMTSLEMTFCRGNKSSSRSPLSCRRKHKKSTARASRSWKTMSSTCRQV